MKQIVYIPKGTPLTIPVIPKKWVQSIFWAVSPELQEIVWYSSQRAMAILTSIPDKNWVLRSSYYYERLNLEPNYDNLQVAWEPFFVAEYDHSIDLTNLKNT